MNLLELHFQRRSAKAAAQTILDTAMAENRSLTVAEQVRFDSLMSRIAELDHDIAARESLRKRVAL